MKGKKQMAKGSRSISDGCIGRCGHSRQNQLKYCGSRSGRMTIKRIIPQLLSRQPELPAAASHTKNGVSRVQEIQDLKEQARAIETKLRSLGKRISDIGHGPTPSTFKVSVDSERCVGCGICQDVCHADAISVEEIAMVDLKRCIGCGSCVEQCPRGALSLYPLKSGYKEQFRVAL